MTNKCGKSSGLTDNDYVAVLTELTGRIARQSFRSEKTNWEELELTIKEASNQNLRSILNRVAWCSRSSMHTGVAQKIANCVVEMALDSKDELGFSTLADVIFDQLFVPCQDGPSLLARCCKWRKVPKYMEMLCTKKWEALSPSLKRLIDCSPDRYARYIGGVDFLALFEAQAQCAVVVMENMFEIYQERQENTSCSTFIYGIVSSILKLEWTLHRPTAYRDDLLCRLFRFLQAMTFSATPSYMQGVFESLQRAIVESIIKPHEGVMLLTKLVALLSKDAVLDISSACFDRCMSSNDSLDAKPYLFFLMGLCAHTRLITHATVTELLVCLFANEPTCTKTLRYQAAYYIAVHRHFDLRPESQLQTMLLEDKDVHTHLPEELVVAFFSTCFKMGHRDIDKWLNVSDIESTSKVNWQSRIPFCSIRFHTRAMEICKLEDEIQCQLTNHSLKRQRTSYASSISIHECLDADVLQCIISYLSPKRLARLALVSRAFHQATLDPYLWQRMYTAPKAFMAEIICHHPPNYSHDFRNLFIERYRSERSLRRQIRLNPAKKTDLACCNICGCVEITKSRAKAASHAEQHTKKKPNYPCPNCSETFSSKSKLKQHTKSHQSNK